jgi:hypothetical protein
VISRVLSTAALLIISGAAAAQVPAVRVDATPDHVINSFDPDRALGSSIDVLSRTGIDKVYTPHIIQEALSAGWGPLTYRNNTELRIAAWHWTENGTWSDPARQSGYFTGSTELKDPIRYILAYSLPHRGFTRTGGGASRTMEGSGAAYWKSNPYLTSRFTRESDSLHPQWVVMDLGAAKPVGAVRIAWASPYARTYQVDYWIGQSPIGRAPKGEWKTFPSGAVKNGQGGNVTLKLALAPVSARYLRVWMTQSSNTCDLHGSDDIRNCVGYAIQEINAGSVDSSGAFVDLAMDSSGQSRPTFITSSIDPWHSAADVNATGAYQHTGFDLLFASGLTNNLPAMIPVTVLYGTPEDAAAQIAYVKKRGYPIGWIEMGEEPDGKHILPEDYAALYMQWAAAIHKVDPALRLGGPVFEGINEDIKVWPDAQGRTSWTARFVGYLRAHGRLSDLAFYSLEHYPFEPCSITWKSLYKEPQMMSHILEAFWENGLPRQIPIMVTESHISWRLTGPMSTIFAALWLADNIGSFFEAGGAAFYHSPIQPQPVNNTCLGWATWSNFVADREYNITGYTSPYFAARMLNLEWLEHRSGVHQMFRASTGIKDEEGNLLVTSYAVHRPDGNWSVLLVNRDESKPHAVRVVFEDLKRKRRGFFRGPVTMVTFGSEQYVWKDEGAASHADPDGPPVAATLAGGPQVAYTLPKASLTVLRGHVAGL